MSVARIVSVLVIVAMARVPLSAAPKPPSSRDVEFFERRVRPLLIRRCGRCHSVKAKPLKGGLRLDQASAIRRGGDSGLVIVAGRPKQSLLIEAVEYANSDLQMPPSGKLPASEIATLVEWVRRGAVLPRGKPGTSPGDPQDRQAARDFWAFRPLRRHHPPTPTPGNLADWPRTRIDRFVLFRLDRHDLVPAAEVGRGRLIRRLSFDLVGLPPAPADVEAFVEDRRPGAYERLVERLLASPHHGERWARVWLDLARYSDTTATWLKSTAQAWRYRDWVVEALNKDLPYDVFVRHQLAADQDRRLAVADRRALGFLGLSPTYWKEPRLSPNLIRRVVAEEWEERIDTIGRTFLGLTLACARCHDHKFDPVSQADYYALAGVLASTRLIDQPLLPPGRARVVREADRRIGDLETAITRVTLKLPAPKDKAVQIARLKKQIEEIKAATPDFNVPRAHAVEDASLYVLADGADMTRLEYRTGQARNLAIQRRGNPANRGPVVPRRFLAILANDPPRPFRQGSGRFELAQALVDPARGGSLAARVIVNRVWREHFGRGLVTTPSNFGHQGERPSHPRMLDDLAARFVEAGWSLKWLHRELVLSATYRQSSQPDPRGLSVDPDNRWIWRMNRHRLTIEAWRDAMLAVSDQLDTTLGGSARKLDDPRHRRRTLYSRIARRELDTMLRLHDFPDPTGHSPKRARTITPLQQLFVLNSPFISRQSSVIAGLEKPGTDPRATIDRLHRRLFGRRAGRDELAIAAEFLAASGPDGWRQYVQVLLGGNEFLFID